jgi:hypothetical protein
MLALCLVADVLGAFLAACLDVLVLPLFVWLGWGVLTVGTLGLYRPDLDEHRDRLVCACIGVLALVGTFGAIVAT